MTSLARDAQPLPPSPLTSLPLLLPALAAPHASPCCANCDSFLGRAELATLDGEPDESDPSEDGVCVMQLARATARGLCASWSPDAATAPPLSVQLE